MMRKIKDIYLIPLKYGVVAATLSALLFLLLYYFGKHPLLIPALFDFRIILFPIFLVFSIRDFKENRNGGMLHYWQGMSVGIQVTLVISILMSLFILLFGGVLEPEFFTDYIDKLTLQLQSTNPEVIEQIGQEAYAKSLEILPSITLLDLSLDYFIKSLPYGLFLTIIISLILRKKPNF
jgi:hypothetical protein